jgi:hypothetical protein
MRRVYIAGPIGLNDSGRLERVRAAIAAGDKIKRLGFAPFIPHLCHFWDEVFPDEYEAWMQYDFVWLATCHALFRVAGESPGADREVAWANANGLPVFVNFGELVAWAQK